MGRMRDPGADMQHGLFKINRPVAIAVAEAAQPVAEPPHIHSASHFERLFLPHTEAIAQSQSGARRVGKLSLILSRHLLRNRANHRTLRTERDQVVRSPHAVMPVVPLPTVCLRAATGLLRSREIKLFLPHK
jgi:hypothetical protein